MVIETWDRLLSKIGRLSRAVTPRLISAGVKDPPLQSSFSNKNNPYLFVHHHLNPYQTHSHHSSPSVSIANIKIVTKMNDRIASFFPSRSFLLFGIYQIFNVDCIVLTAEYFLL